MATLFSELKRRNVIRVAIAYAVSAWVLVQLLELATDAFGAPDWVLKITISVLAIGVIPTLLFSWVYEMTPAGLIRESKVPASDSITAHTAKRLDIAVIVMLVVAIGLFAFDRLTRNTKAPATAATTASESPVTTIATTAADKSVAVLPFVDMSAAGDQEYFTDGLTENLLNALAQIREIKVAGRTSSFVFKGRNQDLRQIGELLNVRNILEGSVQKSGKRVRITTQLVDTSDGFHLWSETFDRDLSDIFSVQDEITAAVVAALRKSILGEDELQPAYSGNFEAYNAYLLGQSFRLEKNTGYWEKAIEQFELAIKIDPDMALAWAGLSLAIASKTGFGFGEGFESGYERARQAALRALELDPNLPEAHLALAQVQISHDWDWDGTEASLRRALQLRPGDSTIRSDIADLMGIRGDLTGALEQNEQALAQDPLNVALQADLVWSLLAADRLDEALAMARPLQLAHPERGALGLLLSLVHRDRGEYEQALQAAANERFSFLRLTMEAILYNDLGNRQQAEKTLAQLVGEFGDDVSYQVAAVYTTWGELDAAFAALDRGFAIRDPGIIQIQRHTTFDPLRDDPRYAAFLEKLGLQ